MSGLDRLDERRVFVDDDAADDGGLQGQALNGCVSVKLNVFSWSVEQIEKTINEFVLADTLKKYFHSTEL
jgi:hypothetical protein